MIIKHMLVTGEKELRMSYRCMEIRNLAEFNRFDMNRSQRRKYHRKIKLNVRNELRLEECDP